MPLILVKAYSGRDIESKKKMAQAMVKAASEASGIDENRFTVIDEDIEKEAWEQQVTKPVVEPLRDKIIIERGKLL